MSWENTLKICKTNGVTQEGLKIETGIDFFCENT